MNVLGKVLLVKSEGKVYPLSINDIMFLKWDGKGTQVFTASRDEPLVDYRPLARLEEQLPQNVFVSVHRSAIVNVSHVEYWSNVPDSSSFVKIKNCSLHVINMSVEGRKRLKRAMVFTE